METSAVAMCASSGSERPARWLRSTYSSHIAAMTWLVWSRATASRWSSGDSAVGEETEEIVARRTRALAHLPFGDDHPQAGGAPVSHGGREQPIDAGECFENGSLGARELIVALSLGLGHRLNRPAGSAGRIILMG